MAFLEQPPHGSASVPNMGAPSLASAKKLPGHRAGGWCHCQPKSHLPGLLEHAELDTPTLYFSGDLAQAKVKLVNSIGI